MRTWTHLNQFLNQVVKDESAENEFAAHDDKVADRYISKQLHGSEHIA